MRTGEFDPKYTRTISTGHFESLKIYCNITQNHKYFLNNRGEYYLSNNKSKFDDRIEY